MKKLIYALSIFCFTHFSYAQQWVNYSNGEHINALLELDGDIWAATEGGLVQFEDGSNFARFFNRGNSPLPSNQVFDLAKTADGRLWITTFSGLAIYDGNNWERHDSLVFGKVATHGNDVAVALPDGRLYIRNNNSWDIELLPSCSFLGRLVADVAINPIDGDIWVMNYNPSCNWGVHRFDGSSWTTYDDSNSNLPAISANDYSLTIDQDGTVWISSPQGLHRFKDDTWEMFDVNGLPNTKIFSLNADSGGQLWAASISAEGFHILNYDGASWTVYSPFEGVEVDEFASTVPVLLNSQYGYYYGTELEGLYKTDLENYTAINTSNSPLPGFVGHQVYPFEDKMWVNTNYWTPAFGNAITYIDGEQWTEYNKEDGQLSSNERFLLEGVDAQGRAWASQEGDIYILDKENGTWDQVDLNSMGAPFSVIKRLEFDGNDRLWIFSNSGVARHNTDGSWTTFTAAETGVGGFLRDIVASSDGERLMFTNPDGVRYFDGTDWHIYDLETTILELAFGPGDILFAAGNFGFYKKDGDTFEPVSDVPVTFSPYGFYSLFFDENTGDLWVSGSDLLARYNDGFQDVYTTLNSGVPSGGTLDINKDAYGNLWLASADGITLFNENGVNWENPLSKLSSLVNSFELDVMPNPVGNDEQLLVQLPAELNGTIEATLFDLQGRTLWQKTIIENGSQLSLQMNDMQLPAGLYTLQVRGKDRLGVARIVVK